MRRCIHLNKLTLGQNAKFTNIQDKLYSFNIQDDQLWAFSKIVQKISKITQYYGQPVLAFDKRQICSASFARVFE